MASQQGRSNEHEPACFGLSSPWPFPSHSGILRDAVVSPWLSPQRALSPWNVPLFRRPATFPRFLDCSRPMIGIDAESPEVVWETPHSLFSLAPTQPAPATNSPNITHFGSLVSSMRATNLTNKIHLLRKVALVLSLPALTSVSR